MEKILSQKLWFIGLCCVLPHANLWSMKSAAHSSASSSQQERSRRTQSDQRSRQTSPEDDHHASRLSGSTDFGHHSQNSPDEVSHQRRRLTSPESDHDSHRIPISKKKKAQAFHHSRPTSPEGNRHSQHMPKARALVPHAQSSLTKDQLAIHRRRRFSSLTPDSPIILKNFSLPAHLKIITPSCEIEEHSDVFLPLQPLSNPENPEDPQDLPKELVLIEAEAEKQPQDAFLHDLQEKRCKDLKRFLYRLKLNVNNALMQNLMKAFPSFAGKLIEKIEDNKMAKFSRQEFFAAYMELEETYRHVRRADYPEMEQMALYNFIHTAIVDKEKGLFLRVKCRVLNEIMPMALLAYHVFDDMVVIVSDEQFIQYFENHIYDILYAILPQVTGAVFSFLLDVITSSSCSGCCGLSKMNLTREEREQLISGAKNLLKGICKKFLNEDIVEGVAGIADVLISGMTRGNSDIRSDTSGLPSNEVPVFYRD
jgi:hypothetical protein